MIEEHIQIDKNLAVKGYKKALKFKAIRDTTYFWATRLFIVWIAIVIADQIGNQGQLIGLHFQFILGLWVIASIYSYVDWYKKINNIEGWDFHAKLDEKGVTTTISKESRMDWNSYANYKEYEDYLQINDVHGGITFLPKTSKLNNVIEFTKTKIRKK